MIIKLNFISLLWNLIFVHNILLRLLVASIADESQINEYEANCNKFGALWVKHITHVITVKLDTLVIVTPESLRMFGTLGALSEQITESIHNVTNLVARATNNIPDEAKRMEYISKVCMINIYELVNLCYYDLHWVLHGPFIHLKNKFIFSNKTSFLRFSH